MKTLEMKEMVVIEGGVTREKYCGTLVMIMQNNPITPSMQAAYGTYCSDIPASALIFPDGYEPQS